MERAQLVKRTASRRNNANDQNQQTMKSKMHNYKQPLYIVTAGNLASGFPLCLLEACTQGPCHQCAWGHYEITSSFLSVFTPFC